MNCTAWKLFAILAAMLVGGSLAQAGPTPNWGGNKTDIDPIVKGTAPGAGGCYAYRTKGGSAWQIACDPQNCERHKASTVANNANTEAIGCAAQIYCYTYGPGAANSSCYLDANACVGARNKMGNSPDLGACVRNVKSGKPVATAVSDPNAPSDTPWCYAYTKSDGGQANVKCYLYKSDCDTQVQMKKIPGQDPRATYPGLKVSILAGCAPAPLYCYSYNRGASGACYLKSADCESGRTRLQNVSTTGSTACRPYQDTSNVVVQ